jgi:uncharacterized membrane protein
VANVQQLSAQDEAITAMNASAGKMESNDFFMMLFVLVSTTNVIESNKTAIRDST